MDESKPALVELLEKCLEFCNRYKKEKEYFLDNCIKEPEYRELTETMKALQLEDIIGSKALADVYMQGKIHGFTVLDNEDIAVSVFCLSAGSYLSLHDHPKMSVMSIVMDGDIRRVSVNLTSTEEMNVEGYPQDSNKEIFTAVVSQDDLLKTNDVYCLTPSSNNIHALYAITNSILFDVLIPNYNNNERNCNFYYDMSSVNVVEKLKSASGSLVGKKLALKYLEFPPEMNDFVVSEFKFPDNSKKDMKDFFV